MLVDILSTAAFSVITYGQAPRCAGERRVAAAMGNSGGAAQIPRAFC
jgi:hypothetical protein